MGEMMKTVRAAILAASVASIAMIGAAMPASAATAPSYGGYTAYADCAGPAPWGQPGDASFFVAGDSGFYCDYPGVSGWYYSTNMYTPAANGCRITITGATVYNAARSAGLSTSEINNLAAKPCSPVTVVFNGHGNTPGPANDRAYANKATYEAIGATCTITKTVFSNINNNFHVGLHASCRI
ncbi:hypothetical protein [Lentzea sp. HUAS12]|uniref:hypothetical protein n=1 Tax=Lentzea sp. HUAS12 TaxID=2951806 RepID=UPI00209CE2B2|nr:hypothetical protein [Lentzea sp. HUAS12]USX56385.1 hypothetical protein ND450_20475 [Lentzea sp. HUAS12]